MEQKTSLGWIGTPEINTEDPELIYFKKHLELSEIPESFPAEISADAKYKLYINGTLVNVGPNKGDRQLWYFDKIDLVPYFKKGINTIDAIVMTIPDKSQGGNYSFARTRTPGFYFSSPELKADNSWKFKKAPVSILAEQYHTTPLHVFEDADGCELNRSVGDENFDKSSWESATIYDSFSLSDRLNPDFMQERPIPLMSLKKKRFTSLQCIRQSEIDSEVWNDFLVNGNSLVIPVDSHEIVEITSGEETTGFLSLVMEGGAGTEIKILTSESYAYDPIEGLEGPPIPRKGDRTDFENGKLYGFTDSYCVSGEGNTDRPEIFEPFWFRTFRFIRLSIETKSEVLLLRDFSYVKNGYPLYVVSSVKTSDKSFEKIWEISERSLRLCMHETYEDCPFYEQLQYAQDARSQILYTYATSADDRLARQAMDDYRRSSRFDGMINCSSPNYENHVIPGFGIFYIAMVYDHMMYFGDKELIKKHMPAILGVLNFLRNYMDKETGLLGKMGGPLFSAPFWSFIDWTDQWRDNFGVPWATHQGALTMESLYFIYALQKASSLFEYIGYSDLAGSLKLESESLQSAVNHYCRGREGMIQDGPGVDEYSQHCQVFALLTDTVDRESGRKYLLETLEHKEDYAQCSVAMMYYLFRALDISGLYERTESLWDLWRNMIKKNLTTCEEDSVLSRSDCHAWGALALYELPAVILGVRPSAPGFSEMEINPHSGFLDWAEGKAVTPHGIVNLSWKKGENGAEIKASVPKAIKLKLNKGDMSIKLTRI